MSGDSRAILGNFHKGKLRYFGKEVGVSRIPEIRGSGVGWALEKNHKKAFPWPWGKKHKKTFPISAWNTQKAVKKQHKKKLTSSRDLETNNKNFFLQAGLVFTNGN